MVKGSGKFGMLKFTHPHHFDHFWHLQSRAKQVGTDFTDDEFGLFEFIAEIGPYPSDMVRPSVGRKDHTKGYVRGNFEWQPLSENSGESTTRTRTGKKQSDKTVELKRQASIGSRRSDESKAIMRNKALEREQRKRDVQKVLSNRWSEALVTERGVRDDAGEEPEPQPEVQVEEQDLASQDGRGATVPVGDSGDVGVDGLHQVRSQDPDPESQQLPGDCPDSGVLHSTTGASSS